VDHQPNPYDGDGPTFSGEEILIVPNPELDAWCEGQDRIEGVDRVKWACRDAAAQYKRERGAQEGDDLATALERCRAREEYVMARAERQAAEFRNLTPTISANEIVRRRLARELWRENLWRRVKANAPLFIAAMAVGAALALFLGRLMGWM
jgi:hypothetical protein